SLLEEPLLLALPREHALAGTSRSGGAATFFKRPCPGRVIFFGPPGACFLERATRACPAAGVYPRNRPNPAPGPAVVRVGCGRERARHFSRPRIPATFSCGWDGIPSSSRLSSTEGSP